MTGSDLPIGLLRLRDLSLDAADLPITIAAATADHPLVWVNAAFERVTGYHSADVVGRNCRFLQGPDTDPGSVEVMRNAVASGRSVTVTLVNYRADGTPFWNQVSLSPVLDAGCVVGFVGIQADVSAQVDAEVALAGAYEAEQTARRALEVANRNGKRAQWRLGLLAEATVQLASTLDVDETLERLGRLVVPALADWVTISLVDERGWVDKIAARHRSADPDLVERYCKLAPTNVTEASRSRQILRGGQAVLVADASAVDWRSTVVSDELADVVDRLGVGSAMYVPLVIRNERIIGSITFVSERGGRVFTQDDLSVANDIGRRATITLDNARLYQREHRAAESLQRSLLPRLSPVAGIDVAARYVAGDTAAEVGGDFYDLLPLPDGSIGVAVGDVTGHDLTAAAAMGQLRGLLRSAAWIEATDGDSHPGRVIDRVNDIVARLDLPFATLLYGVLRPDRTPGDWQFSYASAGHPPALVRTPAGTVHTLDQSQGILLGGADIPHPPPATIVLPAGSTLVAFTDGLVERRHDSVEHGYVRISEALSAHPGEPETLVDRLLCVAGSDHDDDTAILAIHLPG